MTEMRYLPPNRHRGALLLLRDAPKELHGLTTTLQEENCRRYCESKGVPVRHVIQIQGNSKESIEQLKALLFKLPEDVDAIWAARFYCYSFELRALALLCLQFQCRGVWVYSLEFPGPIHQHLLVLRPKDYDEADKIREEMDRQHMAELAAKDQ